MVVFWIPRMGEPGERRGEKRDLEVVRRKSFLSCGANERGERKKERREERAGEREVGESREWKERRAKVNWQEREGKREKGRMERRGDVSPMVDSKDDMGCGRVG